MAFEAKKEEINYLDKDFNKVVMNSIWIEMVYTKCNIFFFLKSKLYKYLKTGCMKIIQALLFLAPLVLPIFLIESKSILQSLGIGLVFRD